MLLTQAALYDQHTSCDVVVLTMCHRGQVNFNYLVIDYHAREAVIVDPAWQIEKIEQALRIAQVSLVGVLLTHSHHDHVNLAKPLAALHDCPILMSAEEIEWSGFSAPQLMAIDETPWMLGDTQIQPILTPGHTPGSTSYLIEDNVFTGDVLFAEGCGLCADEASSQQMFYSLQKLCRQLTPESRIFPGHSFGKPPGLTFAEVQKSNLYLHFNNPDQFAAFRLRRARQIYALS